MNAEIIDNVVKAISSMDLWTAILKSVIIIMVGFAFTKGKILPEYTNKVLTKIVMKICLPCLAFASFMVAITMEAFLQCIFVFVYGFICYAVFILLSKIIFRGVKDKTRRKVLEILFVFGSTTFFGQPLIQAVFPDAYNISSIFNIPYRVFMYSYAYWAICLDNSDCPDQADGEQGSMSFGEIAKQVLLNPIIIATFLGFGLWALQLIGDTTDLSNWWVVDFGKGPGAFWNIKYSCYPIYATMTTIGNLCSPLVWIAIGCTLGKVSLKDAAQDRNVWIFSLVRVIGLPILNFAFLFLLRLIPGVGDFVSFDVLAATTLMWAVPAGTIVVSYCINSNKDSVFASSCSLISTLVAVIFIPFCMVFLTIIESMGIFPM